MYVNSREPTTYVIRDISGKEESPGYAMLKMMPKVTKLKIKQFFTKIPDNDFKISMKWDGEWQVRYEVFKDLGIAFGVVIIILYLVLAGWFGSYINPIYYNDYSYFFNFNRHNSRPFDFGKFFTATLVYYW